MSARASPAPLAEAAPPNTAPSAAIVIVGRSSTDLLDRAGDATFLADRGLSASTIDDDAMEGWFMRPPAPVYFYADRAVSRGTCRPLQRTERGALNELALIVGRSGRVRTLLVLGQDAARAETQWRERGRWETTGVEILPMRVIAWDAASVRYAEGAERYERACVPVLRSAPCTSNEAEGGEGYCVDRELVIRPWRAATVPHVGPVFPGYADAVPLVPEGACTATCEASDCDRAFATSRLPREPLYDEAASELAVFRDRGACRAFERERASIRGGADEGAW